MVSCIKFQSAPLASLAPLARFARSCMLVEAGLYSAYCCGLPLAGILPSCSPKLAPHLFPSLAQTRFYDRLVPWLLYGCLILCGWLRNGCFMVASWLYGVFGKNCHSHSLRRAGGSFSSHIPRIAGLQMQAPHCTPYVYMCALWGAGAVCGATSLWSPSPPTAPAPRRTAVAGGFKCKPPATLSDYTAHNFTESKRKGFW